jgi:hypothetical protein
MPLAFIKLSLSLCAIFTKSLHRSNVCLELQNGQGRFNFVSLWAIVAKLLLGDLEICVTGDLAFPLLAG